MTALSALWLPIVVSAIVVFAASFLAWVVLPHHRQDWGPLPDEEGTRAKLVDQGLEPGQYMIPYCEDPNNATPEIKQKFKEGPIVYLLARPSMPGMGKNLGLMFAFYLAVSFFTAYIASHALPEEASYLAVFRIVGATATLAYVAGGVPNAVWFGRSWSSTFKEALDGVAYGLLTAGVFGWLWP